MKRAARAVAAPTCAKRTTRALINLLKQCHDFDQTNPGGILGERIASSRPGLAIQITGACKPAKQLGREHRREVPFLADDCRSDTAGRCRRKVTHHRNRVGGCFSVGEHKGCCANRWWKHGVTNHKAVLVTGGILLKIASKSRIIMRELISSCEPGVAVRLSGTSWWLRSP